MDDHFVTFDSWVTKKYLLIVEWLLINLPIKLLNSSKYVIYKKKYKNQKRQRLRLIQTSVVNVSIKRTMRKLVREETDKSKYSTFQFHPNALVPKDIFVFGFIIIFSFGAKAHLWYTPLTGLSSGMAWPIVNLTVACFYLIFLLSKSCLSVSLPLLLPPPHPHARPAMVLPLFPSPKNASTTFPDSSHRLLRSDSNSSHPYARMRLYDNLLSRGYPIISFISSNLIFFKSYFFSFLKGRFSMIWNF